MDYVFTSISRPFPIHFAGSCEEELGPILHLVAVHITLILTVSPPRILVARRAILFRLRRSCFGTFVSSTIPSVPFDLLIGIFLCAVSQERPYVTEYLWRQTRKSALRADAPFQRLTSSEGLKRTSCQPMDHDTARV